MRTFLNLETTKEILTVQIQIQNLIELLFIIVR